MTRYADRNDLELIFGKLNVQLWADLDGTSDSELIEERIENACELAGAEIEDILRNRRYKFPLTVSKTLKDLVARMAGLHLHDGRAIIDDSGTSDTVSAIRKQVHNKLALIRNGDIYLEGERLPNHPNVVKDEFTTQDERKSSNFDPFKQFFGQRLP